MIGAALRLLRPKQYSKNIFVFAALLFTKGYLSSSQTLLVLGAFVSMCLLGSATYVANDIIDIERDRAHPRKRFRPLAAGKISVQVAWIISAVCLVLGLAIAYSVRLGVFECGLGYIGLQIAYNAGLKHVPIADVFVIAAGFVLRVVIGAVAIEAQLSGWILLCTASLALLLGFGKRRHEYQMQGKDRHVSRESLAAYNLEVLNAFVISAAAGSAMCYGIYSIESVTARRFPALIVTVPFVVYGICRYTMLIFAGDEVGEPESIVVKDRQMILTFFLFIAAAVFAMSGVPIPLLSQ